MANITNITNIQSVFGAAEFANDVTGGIFWVTLLFCIFIIMIMNMRQYGIDKAVASSSFACLLLSIMLLAINLVMVIPAIIFAVVLAGTLFYIRSSNPG